MKMENIIQDLNQFLADLAVFYRKLQNYHWNVTGKDFFVIHEKLEEYYDEVNEAIDKVAEFILSKDDEPLGTMQDYLNISKIEEAENKKVDSNCVLDSIKQDYSYLLNNAYSIKKNADDMQDYATSTLMDEFISDYTKKLWMIKQTQENN